MKAVTFDVSVPRYLLAKGLGGFTSSVTFGALSGLRLQDVPEPVLPGPDWVRLEVLLAGICGTDIGNITFSSSPVMEPFGSFPAVLGHEILARVVEVGPAVRSVQVGQRVVVEPMLSCRVRGYQDYQCPSCAAGLHGTCEQAGRRGLSRSGMAPRSRSDHRLPPGSSWGLGRADGRPRDPTLPGAGRDGGPDGGSHRAPVHRRACGTERHRRAGEPAW